MTRSLLFLQIQNQLVQSLPTPQPSTQQAGPPALPAACQLTSEQMNIAIENNPNIQATGLRDEIEQSISETVDDIIVENITEEIQETEVLNCEECDFETRMKKKMDTHNRLKRIDVIKFACNKCDYNSNTRSNLEEHQKSHQEVVFS